MSSIIFNSIETLLDDPLLNQVIQEAQDKVDDWKEDKQSAGRDFQA